MKGLQLGPKLDVADNNVFLLAVFLGLDLRHLNKQRNREHNQPNGTE